MAADCLREGCLSACQSWAVSRTKAGRESWQGERAVLCPSLLLQLRQKCSEMWGALWDRSADLSPPEGLYT